MELPYGSFCYNFIEVKCMRLFLCGGGSGADTFLAYQKLNEIIDHKKPVLYVPLAMNKDRYAGCYSWIKNELENIDVPNIEMVTSGHDLASRNLEDYSFVFIGGGNTYKLLGDLKSSGAFSKLKEYIENNGIVFGGSAGAIILGQSIATCKYSDKNDIKLNDLDGFNAVSEFSFLCHFTNQDEEKQIQNTKYLKNYTSRYEKVIALPEEDTIYYEDGVFEILGERPFYVFDGGKSISFLEKNHRKTEFLSLKSPEELMDFMDKNVTYGWIDDNQGLHFNNLKHFRDIYRTSSISEILDTGLGTCIEQGKLIHEFFEQRGIEHKLYCYRHYEDSKNEGRDIHMHCFVLFKSDDFWYHFEHSNTPKKGIHKYLDVDSAINDITSEFPNRELTEIPDIPEGMSFMDFNQYVNQFQRDGKKSL